jgi:hypothetical protein
MERKRVEHLRGERTDPLVAGDALRQKKAAGAPAGKAAAGKAGKVDVKLGLAPNVLDRRRLTEQQRS